MKVFKWIFGQNQLPSLDLMDYRDSNKTILKNKIHQPEEEKNGYIENKNIDIENGYIPEGYFHLLNGNIYINPKNVITLTSWDENNQIEIPDTILDIKQNIAVYSFNDATKEMEIAWEYTPDAYISSTPAICDNGYRFKIIDNKITLCKDTPSGYTTIAFIYVNSHLYQKYDKLSVDDESLLILNLRMV